MQKPEQAMDMEQSPKRKPLLAIGVAAASVAVLVAALFIAHSIFNKSYQSYLDVLKGKVAEQADKLENGDHQADAAGQYRHYLAVENELNNLSDILGKLNGKYPLLLTRANEQSVGLAKLKSRMEGMKPALAAFKQAADEDAAIADELSVKLGQGMTSAGYADLKARNEAAGAKLAGAVFTGALEANRAALAEGIAKRGAALEFLVEDTAIAEQFAAITADNAAAPDDQIAGLNGLIARINELSGQLQAANLAAYGPGGKDVADRSAARQALLSASVSYFNDIKALMAEVSTFNTKLEQGLGQGTKFTERLAAWMTWVKDLNELEGKLKAINGKPEYQALEGKRELTALGLSETGLTLNSYAPALTAVNNAMASSAAMEKEIAAMLKSKARMVDKVTTSTKLLERNEALIQRIDVELPADLSEGLANFAAGCAERNVFLTEYVGYVKDQAVAEGQAANRKIYQNKYSTYKTKAMEYPAGSSDRTFYMNLANDQLTFANQALAEYNASMKSAQAHKKAYEASRKKYVPMLDKVD